jgi:hypothetical protein
VKEPAGGQEAEVDGEDTHVEAHRREGITKVQVTLPPRASTTRASSRADSDEISFGRSSVALYLELRWPEIHHDAVVDHAEQLGGATPHPKVGAFST